jgi:4-amino-4-deoxy-L-arabinose transferase-like glycosyltransferase
LPFLMTWVYSFIGFNDIIVRMIMPVIYAAFLILAYSQMKKLFGRQYSLLFVFILATIPQLADYAAVIHADLVLAAFVTCALLYYVLYIRTGERIPLVLSSLLFGFSLWVKNEAMVFAGAFVASFVFFIIRSESYRKRQKLGDLFICLAILAAVAAPWFAVKLSSAAFNSDITISRLTPGRLLENIRDIPILLNFFQQEVFGPKKWNIFWIMVLAGMIWKRKLLWKGECFYIMLFLSISAAGYFIGYMLTTGNNLYFYVNTTISRFMLHFCGAALLLLAFLVRDDIRAMAGFAGGEHGER